MKSSGFPFLTRRSLVRRNVDGCSTRRTRLMLIRHGIGPMNGDVDPIVAGGAKHPRPEFAIHIPYIDALLTHTLHSSGCSLPAPLLHAVASRQQASSAQSQSRECSSPGFVAGREKSRNGGSRWREASKERQMSWKKGIRSDVILRSEATKDLRFACSGQQPGFPW
jgi:hypothetical protein